MEAAQDPTHPTRCKDPAANMLPLLFLDLETRLPTAHFMCHLSRSLTHSDARCMLYQTQFSCPCCVPRFCLSEVRSVIMQQKLAPICIQDSTKLWAKERKPARGSGRTSQDHLIKQVRAYGTFVLFSICFLELPSTSSNESEEVDSSP